MKAVRLNKIGDFRMEEVPLPEVKGEELLVKVEACGICGSDLPRVFELGAHVHPITIGHEFAGTIVKAAREEDQELVGIEGSPPDLRKLSPHLCAFSDRCRYATAQCRSQRPELEEVAPGHVAACFHARDLRKEVSPR